LNFNAKNSKPENVPKKSGNRITAKTKCQIEKDADQVYEKQMSLPELISNYWDKVMVELNEHQINHEEGRDVEDKDGLEDMDISMFSENLNSVVQLTERVKASLEIFNNYIFYSELYDSLEDIHRTNEYYLWCIETREPEVSKYSLACFLEHVFKFLSGLNEALVNSDMDMIAYFQENLDEVYYQSYIEYFHRGHEPEPEDETELY
jgi:hypothetical protein